MRGTPVLRAIAFAVCALLSACIADGPDDSGPLTVQQPSEAEYRLGPSDRVRIIVFGEAELTGEFVVSASGVISYPLIGDQQAAGKTIPEFTDGLRTALTRYVLQPNVSVEVLNYRPFFILGEVRNPGTYPYSAGLTVMSAVATAGG